MILYEDEVQERQRLWAMVTAPITNGETLVSIRLNEDHFRVAATRACPQRFAAYLALGDVTKNDALDAAKQR